MRFLILDTETTGFVPKVHRVMEVACMVMEDRAVQKEVEHLLSLPEGVEIPVAIQRLTHIAPNDLVGKPTFTDILPHLQELLTPETILVGQNIPFDLGMLRGEGWDLTDHPWIDTSMLASIVFPELASFSLGFMSDVLGLTHTPRHRALGDVRATSELLLRCIDRFQALPPDLGESLRTIASRGPEGYRRFFEGLSARGTGIPGWLLKDTQASRKPADPLPLQSPSKGGVHLVEESLNGSVTEGVLQAMPECTWLAVKNIEATSERLVIPKDVVIFVPPEFLLSAQRRDALLASKKLTADEMTLAMKLHLYQPERRRDVPLHGGEHQVWIGKLGCSSQDPEYQALRTRAESGRAIVSHQHLLSILSEISPTVHIIIDDASMLEDTATNAWSWICHVPTIRAASNGHPTLTRCTDLIELWAEQVRSELDLRYIAPSDLGVRVSCELRELLEDLVKNEQLTPVMQRSCTDLLRMLKPENLDGRITWIESMIDGSKTIKSVPESIAPLLKSSLFSVHPTTLIIPPQSHERLGAILSPMISTTRESLSSESVLRIDCSSHASLENLLRTPIEGKIIVLVASKRSIEDLYVRYSDVFEARGAQLICQGFSGGQGRMQAEFVRAPEGSAIVMTPWMYEGIDLPRGTATTLVLQTLPFDHPNHAVVGRRALRYKDPFNEYSLPRLTQRLWRLLRSFARHAVPHGTVMMLDDRLRTKAYGKFLTTYLRGISSDIPSSITEEIQPSPTKKARITKAKTTGQMSLF